MTHSCQCGLSGAVGSTSEAKSEGRGFKSLFKQIFALTLKLLIDYILSILAPVLVEVILPLVHILSSFPRKFSDKVVCMMYKCKNDSCI